MHVHISTGFLFVSAFSVIGLTGAIMLYKNSKKSRQLEHEERMEQIKHQPTVVHTHTESSHSQGPSNYGSSQSYSGPWGAAGGGRTYTAPAPAAAPVATQASPVVVNSGGNNSGFFEGMLIGDLMASRGNHTEVIREREVDRDYGGGYERRETYSAPEPSGCSYSSSSDDSVSLGDGDGFDLDL